MHPPRPSFAESEPYCRYDRRCYFSPRLQMIATCEGMSEDKLKEMDRLFEQMTTQDGLTPEALTYSHLIYGCAS